jgi:hypothetical protein
MLKRVGILEKYGLTSMVLVYVIVRTARANGEGGVV